MLNELSFVEPVVLRVGFIALLALTGCTNFFDMSHLVPNFKVGSFWFGCIVRYAGCTSPLPS